MVAVVIRVIGKKRETCMVICNKMSSCSFLVVFFLSIVSRTAMAMEYTKISTRKMEAIQNHLEKINKPAIRTIESPDGDIIDCVPRNQQPAFDHPLLRNHKVQIEAPEWPKSLGDDKAAPRNVSIKEDRLFRRKAWQMWHHVGHCPKGTIPTRRSSISDVLRAKSLHHFGKKKPRARQANAPDSITGNGHEHAIAYTPSSGTSLEIYGAKAIMNIWDPTVDDGKGFSLCQLWILSGNFTGSNLNSIEAGWQVNPELYGDNRPRLFTYWTSDTYQATGCYNLLCSGFVQVSNKIAIGAAISPISSLSGEQYDITILVWKDPKNGHWWMSFGNKMLVGYWPAELFTHLSDHATMVEWGGEVVNLKDNGQHTRTQMGSGHFASDGFGKACYMRDLKTVDVDNNLIPAGSSLTIQAESPGCYDIQSFSNSDWGTYIYFGGPGRNSNCP